MRQGFSRATLRSTVLVPLTGLRPEIAKSLGRWDHILLPVVLTGMGLFILTQAPSACKTPFGVDVGVRAGAAGW
jgi:hypothetical protein